MPLSERIAVLRGLVALRVVQEVCWNIGFTQRGEDAVPVRRPVWQNYVEGDAAIRHPA